MLAPQVDMQHMHMASIIFFIIIIDFRHTHVYKHIVNNAECVIMVMRWMLPMSMSHFSG